MNIIEKSIIIERTARYAQLGDIDSTTTDLWIVIHGYAQLARDFLNDFIPLQNNTTVIVAPEGLSRFYAKGFYGNVAATWMTREDRENEIKDYVNYLSKLQLQLTQNNPAIKVNLLGFSQGVATIVRYVMFGKPQFNKLWLCAGEFPTDVALKDFKAIIGDEKLHVMFGTEDPFITEEAVLNAEKLLKKEDIKYNLHKHKGAHVVDIKALINL